MSDSNDEIVEGLIAKPGLNGRRTYRTAAKRALVEFCKRPGVSVAGTALKHGINANLLRRWIVQYSTALSRAARATSRAATVLLPVESSAPHSGRISVDQGACIEITFMGASIRVRGAVDAQALSVVLECLARRA